MQSTWKKTAFYLIFCLIFLSKHAPATNIPPPAHRHILIQFLSYQKVGEEYLFRLHFQGVPEEKQPSPKKKGDPIGFSNYLIGDFHQIFESEPNPNGTHAAVAMNDSTLEIVKPDTGSKVLLRFRKTVDVPE